MRHLSLVAIFILAGILGALLALPGCGGHAPTLPSPDVRGHIRVHTDIQTTRTVEVVSGAQVDVYTEQGQGNALVWVDQVKAAAPVRSGMTGWDGNIVFENLTPGRYRIVSRYGESEVSTTASVIADHTTTVGLLHMYPAPAGDLRVCVVTGQGNPVPNAVVTVTCGGGSKKGVTGPNGCCTIYGLPGGKCTVTVEADGYTRGYTTVTITIGSTTSVTINVNPS